MSRVWLAGVVAGFIVNARTSPVNAQEIQPQSLVNRVPASVTTPQMIDEAHLPALHLPTQPTPTPGMQPGQAAAFEREYEKATYGRDWAALNAEQPATQLEFSYNAVDPAPLTSTDKREQPDFALPLFGASGQMQLRSDLTTHDPQTGAAYIGLKLNVPFGSGM